MTNLRKVKSEKWKVLVTYEQSTARLILYFKWKTVTTYALQKKKVFNI